MFSTSVERALRVAMTAHAGQLRKGIDEVPYVTHPFHVALMLARLGCDEIVIQAGLLHDVVEDCEGWSVERVAHEFSPAVAAIVRELTEDKTKSWEERKRWAVDHVPHMSAAALAVKAADKLHNLECLVDDLQRTAHPEHVWGKFKGGRDRTLAMSSALVESLAPRVDARLGEALRATLRQLTSLTSGAAR